MRKSLLAVAIAASVVLALAYLAPKPAGAAWKPHDIAIDGSFSDWADIAAFITDDNTVGGTTYYWNNATSAWQTADPGYPTDHTNYEKVMDLVEMKMVHDETNIYVMQHFAQPQFVYTDSSGHYAPFNASRPAPAEFNHRFCLSFDVGSDGLYDYYLTPSFYWPAGATSFSQMQITITLYRDSNNGQGWDESDEVVIVVSEQPDSGNGMPDMTGQSPLFEMREPRSLIFDRIGIENNQPFNVRFEAYSDRIEASDASSYTLAPQTAVALGNPGSFVVKPASRAADLWWTQSTSGGTSKYRVVRKEGSEPAHPWDGTEAYEGNALHYRNTGLTNNTKYYYKVYAMDDANNYSSGLARVAVPNKLSVAVIPARGTASVKTYYGLDGTARPVTFTAFPRSMRQGGSVAVGDIDADGKAEFVVGAGSGAAPQVRMYEHDGTPKGQFYAYCASCRFGVNVAVGDVDRDGKAEIVTVPGKGGASHVRVFRGTGSLFHAGFYAYGTSFKEGASLALGDIDGDGADEIITGALTAGRSRIRAFEYWGAVKTGTDFYAYGSRNVGAYVAAGDIDGDGTDEIITGADAPGTPHVRIFEPNGALRHTGFLAFGNAATGVTVSAGDIDADGVDEVIAGTGRGSVAQVRVFEFDGTDRVMNVQPYGASAKNGVMTAVGAL